MKIPNPLSALGMPQKLAIIGGAIALLGLAIFLGFKLFGAQIENRVEEGVERGALTAANQSQARSLENVEAARSVDVVSDPERDLRLCRKYATNPEFCE